MKTLPEKPPHRGEVFVARSSEFLFSEMSEVFHAESVKLNSRRHQPPSPGRRVAFKDKNINRGRRFVNPHPNPHVGEGEKKKRCDEYRLFLHGFASGDQVNYQDDQGEHQQQVDESTQRITGHQPDQPQYQQNHKDCPQHCRVPPLQAMEIALLLELVGNVRASDSWG